MFTYGRQFFEARYIKENSSSLVTNVSTGLHFSVYTRGMCVFYRIRGVQFNADTEQLNREILLGSNVCWFVIGLQELSDRIKCRYDFKLY